MKKFTGRYSVLKAAVPPVLLLLAVLLFTSCRSWGYQPPETFYYTIDYLPYTEMDNLIRSEALPYHIWVHPTEIPRTYSRRQIVIRHFGPKISFSDNNLWAGRLNDYYPRLMTSRLEAYNSFRSIGMEFLTSNPDFEIDMNLHRMELLQSEVLSEAHLDIDFFMKRSGSRETAVRHNARRVRNLYSGEIDLYVQTINEILLEEMDRFIEKIYRFFGEDAASPEFPAPEAAEQAVRVGDPVEDAPEGQGILLLPSLSGIHGIGTYRVIGADGREYFGEYGIDLPLAEGEYSVEYGSGPRDLIMLRQGIKVRRGYRTLVEPDWGGLTIEIINERRDPQDDVIYELFEASTGQSIGAEYPAREDLGDLPRVWHLKPGLYKVTVDNAPFSTYRNFTTLLVEEGKYKRLTIVVENPEGLPAQLIGAGVLDEEERGIAEGNWRFMSAVYGDFNLTGEHSRHKEEMFKLDLSAQWDNNLRYAAGPFSYNLIHYSDLHFEFSKDGVFKIIEDDFDIKNSAVIDVFRGIGLYTRFDLNTHFFEKYEYDPPAGWTDDKVLLDPPFFPLVLKEGIGLNMRLLNTPRSSLTFRGGFELRQEYNEGVYDRDNSSYLERENRRSAGLGFSALAFFQPFPRLQFSMNGDIIFPFIEGDDISLEVESGLNLTLLRYLSLNYKFGMRNAAGLDDFGLEFNHRLVLRLTYILN